MEALTEYKRTTTTKICSLIVLQAKDKSKFSWVVLLYGVTCKAIHSYKWLKDPKQYQ